MPHRPILFLWFTSLGCAAAPPANAVPAASPADAACAAWQTPDQRRDEATLRRIEHDWLAAELQGDTRFLECLLLPDYVTIRKDGAKRPRSELIAHVGKNAGRRPEIPEIVSIIAVHGDVATAYSSSRLPGKDGEVVDAHFIDSFVFIAGAWHAYAGVDL
jgi:hypothetical protein